MDASRWRRIQALFHETAEIPQAERRAFLESRCGDDPTLTAEVLALLDEDAREASILDRSLSRIAQDVLEGAAPVPLPGGDFGPYRIRRLLGEGGMGVVYLAEREDLGSFAALKILRDASLSPARRERFAIEQRTLAQLNHPAIARLYDADTLPDGTPWFVMEYVEGLPLTRHCDARGLSIPDRLGLFRAVCEAVRHAHLHAVIHRDLKPSNILVKDDGSVKLLDFGIAKQLESLETPADQTRTALRLMTPAYAAPEQVRGERIGTHTDVYALGVILYELLTGRVPFDLSNRTPGEAQEIIVHQEPERPSAAARGRAGELPASPAASRIGRTSWADLDVLCLTAMHKDVSRRYRSVEALMRDIDHYLNAEPLEARPDSVRYRLGKFVRRNRGAVIAATLVIASIVGLVSFYTVRLAIARDVAVAEAARTQRIQRFMLDLFEGDDETAGPADDLRVVTLVDRGVQKARALDGDPAVQAELYLTLGSIYQKLGKIEPAESLLSSALDRRRILRGRDHPDVAESLVALGLLRADQARLEEAEQLIREGLEMSRRTLPPRHPAVARAASALGQVLEARGLYDQAFLVLEEAVSLQSEPGSVEADLLASLTELANCHFYAGHYDIAGSLNRRVIDMDRRLFGDRHPNVAHDLINLGAIAFQEGRYAEAEQSYRQALDIFESFYGKDHPETGSALTMLGRALNYQGKVDQAADLLRDALAIQERVYGKVHYRVASVLNELGNIAVAKGRLDEAEADFSRLIDIYRGVYGDRHYLIGTAEANLANVYQERKEYSRAESLVLDVLRRYGETLPADHPSVGMTRIRLGRLILRQNRFEEAESQTLAGYEILMKQASPPDAWIRSARKDLVEIYGALHQPEKAAGVRAAMASADAGAQAPADRR